MTEEEILSILIDLEAKKNATIKDSTDANKWKVFYDKQIELIKSYAKEQAVEFAAYLDSQNMMFNKEIAKDCYEEFKTKQVNF